MGSAFHQLCPRYSGTLTPTAPTAIRLWDTFTFTLPVISGRWEEDSIKLCAMELVPRLVHVFHVSSEEKVASMCVMRGWG